MLQPVTEKGKKIFGAAFDGVSIVPIFNGNVKLKDN